MDASIATSDNLRKLRRMGYDYLCVTRNRIKDYTISPDHTTVDVTDSRGKRITLRWVQPTGEGDTYFEVVSPTKALTLRHQ